MHTREEQGDRSNKARSAGYWTTTTLTALAFLTGGAAYLSRADFALEGMAELGYPAYFVTILGTWKVLGGLAILAPRLPRLKEWAYAGIVFDLTGAAFSHVAAGHPAAKGIAPLVILGIAAASWALRPASRRLGAKAGEPASTTSRYLTTAVAEKDAASRAEKRASGW